MDALVAGLVALLALVAGFFGVRHIGRREGAENVVRKSREAARRREEIRDEMGADRHDDPHDSLHDKWRRD